MSSVFPQTSITLIKKLSGEMSGESEVAWTRFFDLYSPAIRKFAEWSGGDRDPDDIVQDVMLRLLEALRNGRYNAGYGRFRSFLATLIRRQLVDLYRREQARGAGLSVPIDDVEPALPPEQAEIIDMKWRLARHEAAVEHVLTRTALSRQSKDIYRAHVIDGRSAADVSKAFGVTKNLVGQVKFRVDRAIAALESELAD